MLLGLTSVNDPRFTEYYETVEPGLVTWLSQVIDENARVHSIDPSTACWE